MCDYCSLDSKGDAGSEHIDYSRSNIAVFVVKEHNSKNRFATVVHCKGIPETLKLTRRSHFFNSALLKSDTHLVL